MSFRQTQCWWNRPSGAPRWLSGEVLAADDLIRRQSWKLEAEEKQFISHGNDQNQK
jgi:hypothetical protein